MSEFLSYLKLGYLHITDLNGFDHILFIIALCAVYSIQRWKEVLILITAFTLGHSATLALSVLDIVSIDAGLIEFIIPLTIMATCLVNFFHKFPKSIYKKTKNNKWVRYALAVVFGLIHGLGFSNYLKSLLGAENSIVVPLFSFNLGLELGQILIVVAALAINFLLTEFLKVKQKTWNLILSGIVFGMALMLVIQ
ncbi:HupE/UreJ family protein [Jiulongibacter sp. NS-SX5]|uniref:HupE/UreJ family protein n=1 Tax=Jiulongibacter sp. NS-SX5 TaxID=3463854 RepID=UPI004059C90A